MVTVMVPPTRMAESIAQELSGMVSSLPFPLAELDIRLILHSFISSCVFAPKRQTAECVASVAMISSLVYESGQIGDELIQDGKRRQWRN